MKRGEFLKLSCNACLLGAAGLVSLTELLSCAPAAGTSVFKTALSNGAVSVPAAQLPAGKVTIVRAKGVAFDIAVRRLDGDAFEALLLRCTHFSNPLVQSGNGYHCNLHGSEFGLNGQVRKGPAAKPLPSLPCRLEDGNLIIHV